MSTATDERYTIISADCHAGGNHAQYREYLSAEWQDEFDAWRGEYSNPFRDLQDDGRARTGTTSGASPTSRRTGKSPR